jgi:hypothetical protein
MFSKSMLVLAGLTLTASPTLAAQQPVSKSQDRAPEKTYCLKYVLDTGSRINRTECKTKKEWSELGVDVSELRTK